jgi:RNA polymerase sigma-70 factor (ECF subfamily)
MTLRDDSQVLASLPLAGGTEAVIGEAERLGRGLEAFRAYLTVVARRGLARDLEAKVGVSDLVQETFLAAERDFAGVQDRSPANVRRWLAGILRHLLANTRRRYRSTQKRRVGRERAVGGGRGRGQGQGGGDSRQELPADLSVAATSPSMHAMRREREEALREALMRLPEHYRQVIHWHHEERLTFEAIAGRLEISPEAARKVWGRALLRLRETMGPGHDPR